MAENIVPQLNDYANEQQIFNLSMPASDNAKIMESFRAVNSTMSTKANQREVMAHGAQALLNFPNVLAMASSVTVDTSIFAYGGTILTEAADSPTPNSEMQYLVLMDYGDRRTVLAIQYTNADPVMWIREIYQSVWRQNKWTRIATTTPTVTQLTPLNGLTVTGNNICKLSDCGAAKVINAELQFSTNIPAGIAILYTGVFGVHAPIICSIFDQYDGGFLGQKVAWHYVDGRVAMFGGDLFYNPAYGPYNILQISAVIGG